MLGLNIQFPPKLSSNWQQFSLLICRDWGGELAFPLPHNTSTPRSWLQDEEEVIIQLGTGQKRGLKNTSTPRSWLQDEEEVRIQPSCRFDPHNTRTSTTLKPSIGFATESVKMLMWSVCGGKLVGTSRDPVSEWLDTNLAAPPSPLGQLPPPPPCNVPKPC